MRLVADLHLHSRHSLATSPKLDPVHLDRWARIKGIDLLGTGDCTHPVWLGRLEEELEEGPEAGLYRLKPGLRKTFDATAALAEGLPEPAASTDHGGATRFVLTGEISTIYSAGGSTRKVHHLVLLPNLAAARRFQSRLERVGNIASDGRPILGLDSRDLLEILLEADPASVLVPAHIWTPWFSALGSRSGFDSIGECYRDLAEHITAIETGLSSNPPMNWAVSSLDPYAIISNSDAHSPEKLGREATILDIEASFEGLAAGLGEREPGRGVLETLEFFPQEGKYHWDGHRACGVVLSPAESAQRAGLCPVCGKPLTPGVSQRVAELADRPVDEVAPCPEPLARGNRRPYRSLIPLPELLGEILQAGPGTKKVLAAYGSLIGQAGGEFGILLDRPGAELRTLAAPGLPGELLAEAVERMRSGRVHLRPGYDGEYGVITAFAPGEVEEGRSRGLFGPGLEVPRKPPKKPERAPAPPPGAPHVSAVPQGHPGTSGLERAPAMADLDEAQARAVAAPGGPTLVVAGPGSGKTAVLALRIAELVRRGTVPEAILALTFTNKAAEELGHRIARVLGEDRARPIRATTFHAYGRALLRNLASRAGLPPGLVLLDEAERREVLSSIEARPSHVRSLQAYIEARKRFLILPGEAEPRLGPGLPPGLLEFGRDLGFPGTDLDLEPGYAAYREALRRRGAMDFEDLVGGTVRLLSIRPDLLAEERSGIEALFVDEYQDVNFAQYALVRLLAPKDLWVIGDPDQAIYGFRGSDLRFLEGFRRDYPEAQVLGLTRSFRCPEAIMGAASRLVGSKLQGRGRALSLERTTYPSDKAEAEGVARAIDGLIGGTRFFALDSGVAGGQSSLAGGLSDCAIILRASALAPAFCKALADHGLPWVMAGEQPWWEEGEAARLVGILRSLDPDTVAASALTLALGASPEKAAREAAARLLGRVAEGARLGDLLDDLALGLSQDGLRAAPEGVRILTIHASKGLEFSQVFLPALEEGILPFSLYGEPTDRDEERRLLYVAMTRSRGGLHLSWARRRRFRHQDLELPPSSFLADLEDLVPQAPPPDLGWRDSQLDLF